MAKTKRPTENLNLALAHIENALRMASREDVDCRALCKEALLYCEKARDALLSIQFHAAQI